MAENAIKAERLNNVSPDYSDNNSATTTVTISGSGFNANATVSFINWDRTLSVPISSITASEIVCDLPVNESFGGWDDIIITNPNSSYDSAKFWIRSQVGTYISDVIYLEKSMGFSSASWSANLPASSTLAVKFRSADNGLMTGAADWSACSPIVSVTSPILGGCVANGQKYIQYAIDFVASYPAEDIATSSFILPILNDLTISYEYLASGTLVSSPFDVQAAKGAMTGLNWLYETLDGSVAKIQLRTVPDNGGVPGVWKEWFGASGVGTFYTNQGNVVIYPEQYGNDQYLQYRILLDPNGVSLPTVGEIELEYTLDASGLHIKSGAVFQRGTNFK